MIDSQLPLSTDAANPFRPRGGFPSALAQGFVLRAPERLIYLGHRRRWRPARRPGCVPRGWHAHALVAADGRLVRAALPPDADLFVWEAGRGPSPAHSVCGAGRAWARVRPSCLNALPPAELDALHRLWRQFGPATKATRSDQ